MGWSTTIVAPPDGDMQAYIRSLPRLIAAEDARFCEHHGFDFNALQKAYANNEAGKKIRGGSTISQQTAKNVFLWPGRDWIRKGLEAGYTVLIEAVWSKRRIMEVYLNVAEFAPGVYGAEAGARHWFGKSAEDLTAREAGLPVVLSREEIARLIAACNNLKHQTALSLAYATGLRASEVVSLKVSDVDSGRMTLRVEQGKGRKDRYAMLSPLLLERLRVWWRVARAQGKMLDGGWLFPGLNPIESLSSRQLNRAVQAAAQAAGIDKRVSMHTLRHCFATHLLEQKVDIRIIQALLGHKKLDTTVIYTQVATDLLREVVSPLEMLQPA